MSLTGISVDLDKLRAVPCHRLGKMDRTIVKFLNRKDAENVFLNEKKLKDVDIFCLLSDGIQDRNYMTTGGRNRKIKILITQNFCPYYRYLYGLVKKKKTEVLIFYFRVLNGTIRMRELQDSCVIKITQESEI